MPTKTAKKKPTAAEAKRDKQFAQHQAQEIRRMKRQQAGVRDLSRQLARVARDADMARVDATRVLVDGTPFTIVSAQWRHEIEHRAELATNQVADLQKQLDGLTERKASVPA